MEIYRLMLRLRRTDNFQFLKCCTPTGSGTAATAATETTSRTNQGENISISSVQLLDYFLNWTNPASFSFIFGLFKQTIKFSQQINMKIVISSKYMAPGFEHMTSQT